MKIPPVSVEEIAKFGASVLKTGVKAVGVAAKAVDRLVDIATSDHPEEKGEETLTALGTKLDGTFEKVREEIREDVEAVKERDPAARNDMEILLLYSGVHAILAYRVAHKLYLGKHYFSARLLSQLTRHMTGIEIHPGATIGKKLFIDHGMGVVIGETTEIGDNCTLYQGVTLGGTGKDTGKRHPTLGNNVMIGSGAKVLGPIAIGDNSKIASGAVVLQEIPAHSTAVGIPAKIVRRGGQKVVGDTDQVHIPDPVAIELKRLADRIALLEKEHDITPAETNEEGGSEEQEN